MNDSLWVKTKNYRALLFLLGIYAGATQLAQTMLYTVVAYIVSAAEKTGTDFGNTVNEIAAQYHFFVYALAAAAVAFTTWKGDQALYRESVFWNEPHKPIWQLNRHTKSELLQGLASGCIVLAVFLFLFTLSRKGTFLGIYLTSTFRTPAFPLFFLDFASLAALVFCEEYIFRHRIFPLLLSECSENLAVIVNMAVAIFFKSLQFELTWMECLNLGLLNIALGYFYLRSGRAHKGIGFLLGFVCLSHSLTGLPLWENESPSFFLFKAVDRQQEILFGGALGPFGGLALTTILLVFAIGGKVGRRKDLEAKQYSRRNQGMN